MARFAFLVLCLIAACGTSTANDAGADGATEGSTGVVCCPRGGASCAGGGSMRLHPGCGMACDCLMITGSATDEDGCVYDVYKSTYPNCGGMVKMDAGTDSSSDAPEGG